MKRLPSFPRGRQGGRREAGRQGQHSNHVMRVVLHHSVTNRITVGGEVSQSSPSPLVWASCHLRISVIIYRYSEDCVSRSPRYFGSLMEKRLFFDFIPELIVGLQADCHSVCLYVLAYLE